MIARVKETRNTQLSEFSTVQLPRLLRGKYAETTRGGWREIFRRRDERSCCHFVQSSIACQFPLPSTTITHFSKRLTNVLPPLSFRTKSNGDPNSKIASRYVTQRKLERKKQEEQAYVSRCKLITPMRISGMGIIADGSGFRTRVLCTRKCEQYRSIYTCFKRTLDYAYPR